MQPAREIYVRVLGRSGEAVRIINTLPGLLGVRLLPPGYKHGQGGAEAIIAPPPVPESMIAGNPVIPPPPSLDPSLGPIPTRVVIPTDGAATIYVRLNGDDVLLSVMLARLTQAGIQVFGFEEAVGDLEEIFLRTTKGLVQ
jgi:hypothetical protein